MNSVQQAHQIGQAVWLDYIRRSLLNSGEFGEYVEKGISGVTSNPTIFEKAIIGSTDYDDALLQLAHTSLSTSEIYEHLAIEDISSAAQQLRATYEQTGGIHGYVSIEVSPLLAHNTEGTISEARRLITAINLPNVMIKVPATTEGLPAIRKLISEGINVNVTLIFSLKMYEKVIEAYIEGINDRYQAGGDISRVASVASFFISRIDNKVDEVLTERIKSGDKDLAELLGKAAIANARLAYQLFKKAFYSKRFGLLSRHGAHVQRLLWASTGTKNPAYSDVTYVEPLIGINTVNTMPPATIQAFLDHGHAEQTIEKDLEKSKQIMKALGTSGINMDEVTDQLLLEGIGKFVGSFEKLESGIESKKSQLMGRAHVHPGVSLGNLLPEVEKILLKLNKDKIIQRIWNKDHTAWKPDADEITNRLGWLSITELMEGQISALKSFANEIKADDYSHIVLLGMGGSSLGPEVLKSVFGNAKGFPELKVLDSTVPASINKVSEMIHPANTLFIVSSKSGTTIEPLLLYSYFRGLVDLEIGDRAGNNFVAITDPGTPLEELARRDNFRAVFLNVADIGGRYSVLSYFGLVPASLIGIDIATLIDRADTMKEACQSSLPIADNPGAWLGAIMGAMAIKGRDKLTLITSPSINRFGLWVEQLIAESTGKEGKGIIPIVNEPLVAVSHLGNDRYFVYLRLKSDRNDETDEFIEEVKKANKPVYTIDMSEEYDIGAEFFRWELGTAVAGAILGIHPFNQPDVQQAKLATENALNEYERIGRLPEEDILPPDKLFLGRREGSYIAIMAYIREAPEIDAALMELRQKITEKYHIATTSGYGPRFLHSTGQLHKGGPDKGIFLQITSDHEHDLPLKDKPYTFGTVADAQALGDLRALKSRGRTVARKHLKTVNHDSITKIAGELSNE